MRLILSPHELFDKAGSDPLSDFSNMRLTLQVLFTLPVKGEVYTIRNVFEDSYHLAEILNPVDTWPFGVVAEPRFFKWRFRPLLPEEVCAQEEEMAAVA